MNWINQGEEKYYSFQGAYHHHIELVVFPKQLMEAKHVVILPYYKDQILFTKHKTRGLEWPGGKVEPGETELQAALRELKEETGAVASSIWCVGQYKVYEKEGSFFVKNIYLAHVHLLYPDGHSGEDTDGGLLFPFDVQPTKEEGFSPLVTDPVFSIIREALVEAKKRVPIREL